MTPDLQDPLKLEGGCAQNGGGGTPWNFAIEYTK
jgi:hypothetical protein